MLPGPALPLLPPWCPPSLLLGPPTLSDMGDYASDAAAADDLIRQVTVGRQDAKGSWGAERGRAVEGRRARRGRWADTAPLPPPLFPQTRKQHGFTRVAVSRGVAPGDMLIMDLAVSSRATGQPLPGLTHSRFSFDTDIDPLGLMAGGARLGRVLCGLCGAVCVWWWCSAWVGECRVAEEAEESGGCWEGLRSQPRPAPSHPAPPPPRPGGYACG